MTENTENPPKTSVINVNTHVALMTENPCGYSSFNICFIPTYTNNQLCYYHMISAMLNANKAAVKNQLKDHKALLKLIN